MDIEKFKKMPLLGILRGIEAGYMAGLVESVSRSGLYAIEITMNTKDAANIIREAVKASGRRLAVGAGTVLDKKMLKSALDAGASFIVTPVMVEEVVGYCVKNRIPVFPGAFSPLEIYRAWASGADMVKVFPAGTLGPGYFREMRGPFNGVGLLACGGVTPENLKDYIANGATAAAFGASVFKKEWLEREDFKSISGAVRAFVESYKSCQS